MSDLYRLTYGQMALREPFFPKSDGRPQVAACRVPSSIILVNRNGPRWRDAPTEYGPTKILYDHWKRWRDKGVRVG